jgi:hypothetical protein
MILLESSRSDSTVLYRTYHVYKPYLNESITVLLKCSVITNIYDIHVVLGVCDVGHALGDAQYSISMTLIC